jgi:hypothetical protein
MSNTTHLRILQYNVRKECTKVMTPLLEDDEVKNIDVLAIQEPWFNKKTGSFYNPGFSRFHLLHKTGEDTRTCFYVNKRLKVDDWDVEFSGGDCCSLRLRREEGPNIWIHNIYNPSPSSVNDPSPPQFIDSLQGSLNLDGSLNSDSSMNTEEPPHVEGLLNRSGEHIVLGDFNLHHPSWNNHGRFTYHASSDALLEWAARRQLKLTLPADSVTWRARGSESAIDLVFMTEGAHNAMTKCGTREDLQVGSDHISLLTEFEWTLETQEPPRRRA